MQEEVQLSKVHSIKLSQQQEIDSDEDDNKINQPFKKKTSANQPEPTATKKRCSK